MNTKTTTRLVMLGTAPAVAVYREQGLFKRWPIDYFAARWPALRHMAAAVAQRQSFAVHAHMSARGFWRDAALLAPVAAARMPVLAQLHGGGYERFYDGCDPAARALVRTFLERAACVIVSCEAMRTWVRATARNAHVKLIPAPVPFEPLAKDPCRPSLVLFLGHLQADKGIFDLLEALAALRHDVPDVRLVCAGDGNRIAVARYAERLGIADAVKFTGWVGPSGKRALFESAAVLAAPAYDAALPVSLLEAMAAGVPAVASAVGGMPEVIVDGVTGVLIAPGDSASLTRHLRALITDRERAARIGGAARDSLRLRFSPERALPMLEELYASAGVQALPGEIAVRKLDLKEAA
jgi:glycosyltransferase involved in cell wall biosynthesis